MCAKYLPLIITCLSTIAVAAPNYPFPQKANYSGNIISETNSADVIQKYYEGWVTEYYEENSDGKLARIRFDKPEKTVSEGIGYGMLIMAYMENEKNKTQAKFDKLWAYYKNFPDDNGLMHWRIIGFDSADAFNAATDAEVDVVLALIMAYKQWGDEKYLTNARWLAEKILKHEVNDNNQLVSGDAYTNRLNPSYFSIVAMEMCRHIEITTDEGVRERWKKVIDNSYSIIRKSRDQSTGGLPDWTNLEGEPDAPFMGYDAIRVPWRMAWAYAWFGHPEAKEICDKISNNAVTQGTIRQDRTYIGAFALSAMTDSTKKVWMKDRYNDLNKVNEKADTYFGHTLNILYQLLMTGNMPNLYAQTPNAVIIPVSKTSNTLSLDIVSEQNSSQVKLSFHISSASMVNLAILDSKGRIVSSVAQNRFFSKGEHTITQSLNSSKRLAKGVYFAHLTSGDNRISKKFVISR